MADIRLRPWGDDDFPLLQLANAPEMTAHLGGPETDDGVRARHEKYLRLASEAGYGVHVIERDGVAVGAVNWWPSQWQEALTTEMGWFVVPAAQRQGVAAAGVRLAIADARARAEHRTLFAFPDVANAASSRLCAVTGFVRRGEMDFPFRAAVLHVGVWAQDLDAPNDPRSPRSAAR